VAYLQFEFTPGFALYNGEQGCLSEEEKVIFQDLIQKMETWLRFL
jgi:hypothetical protein